MSAVATAVELVVDVPGTPVPQGSMQGFVRGRRVVLVADNAKDLKPWRASVAAHCLARVRLAGWRTLVGPCAVSVAFWLPRPAIAYRRRWPHVKPDVDKLARAALDGIVEGGAIHDDALVVDLTASKRYAVERPGMRVRVVDLTGQPTLDGEGC